jgi:hypothetical protein
MNAAQLQYKEFQKQIAIARGDTKECSTATIVPSIAVVNGQLLLVKKGVYATIH